MAVLRLPPYPLQAHRQVYQNTSRTGSNETERSFTRLLDAVLLKLYAHFCFLVNSSFNTRVLQAPP